MSIRAVGFDIDGTLYPDSMMFAYSIPILLKNPNLLYHYGRARKILRDSAAAGEEFMEGFRTRQAKAVLRSMGRFSEEELVNKVKRRVSRKIYGSWDSAHKSITSYKNVRGAWLELKKMGLKLGLLSDFPLGIKPDALQIADLSDAFCCSEDTGYLKPRKEPFLYLAEKLECKPSEIMYVGNSYDKDIIGARAAGMRTALFTKSLINTRKKYPQADIIFSRYIDLPKLLTSYLL
ncbi:MAG: HAD family hydrolase [Spirochaetales bacterium]|nr:HAD family hydrolase [Spirochaetales bacterium]